MVTLQLLQDVIQIVNGDSRHVQLYFAFDCQVKKEACTFRMRFSVQQQVQDNIGIDEAMFHLPCFLMSIEPISSFSLKSFPTFATPIKDSILGESRSEDCSLVVIVFK